MTGSSQFPHEEATREFSEDVRGVSDWVRNMGQAAVELALWAPSLDWSDRLRRSDITENERLLEAFSKVRRYDFLPDDMKLHNGENSPLPIGHEQTNSQPSTVALMLDWLDLQQGQKVLDIGVGSGWTTALIADMVGPEGAVHGTERIRDLFKMAQANLKQYEYPQARLHHTPRRLGYKAEAPYDRILVSAAIKGPWLDELFERQLAPEGVIVAPVATERSHGTDHFDKELLALQKNGTNKRWVHRQDSYSFVPLVLPESTETK